MGRPGDRLAPLLIAGRCGKAKELGVHRRGARRERVLLEGLGLQASGRLSINARSAGSTAKSMMSALSAREGDAPPRRTAPATRVQGLEGVEHAPQVGRLDGINDAGLVPVPEDDTSRTLVPRSGRLDQLSGEPVPVQARRTSVPRRADSSGRRGTRGPHSGVHRGAEQPPRGRGSRARPHSAQWRPPGGDTNRRRADLEIVELYHAGRHLVLLGVTSRLHLPSSGSGCRNSTVRSAGRRPFVPIPLQAIYAIASILFACYSLSKISRRSRTITSWWPSSRRADGLG